MLVCNTLVYIIGVSHTLLYAKFSPLDSVSSQLCLHHCFLYNQFVRAKLVSIENERVCTLVKVV
jgi:hypothetical protein